MGRDHGAAQRAPNEPGGVNGGGRYRARARRAGASGVRGAAGEVGQKGGRAALGGARTEPQNGALRRASQGGHVTVRGTHTRSFLSDAKGQWAKV